MSCLIHDRCTCCSTSLQYTASITSPSQFAPQSGDIVLGYEWAAPLVSTPGGPWHTTVDPGTFRPSSSLYSGQDLSQQAYCPSRNSFETMPPHHTHYLESLAHAHEQKQALPPREQVSILFVNVLFQAQTRLVRDAAPILPVPQRG